MEWIIITDINDIVGKYEEEEFVQLEIEFQDNDTDYWNPIDEIKIENNQLIISNHGSGHIWKENISFIKNIKITKKYADIKL